MRASSDMTYTIPYEGFCTRVERLEDSGVGCDSLLYSCWRHCHEEARVALYSMHLHLLVNDIADSEIDFLISRLVFIQKGRIDVVQAGSCRRHPIKTRPLCLASTDCKIISCMISMILSGVCSACIASNQAGGMKGHQMIDLISLLRPRSSNTLSEIICRTLAFSLLIYSRHSLHCRGDIYSGCSRS